MKRTILITGCSSGVGKAAALLFAERGFNVVATMRDPDKGRDLSALPGIYVQRMDVTDVGSVEKAIKAGIAYFGSIDVLLNNAGIGVLGGFEAADPALIQQQFDTNVFGVMRTIKAILPHFRAKKQGMIINISSGVGIIPIPMQSLYDSTKFALEGFSESLYYELAAIGIRLKIVLPGAIKSNFFHSMRITDVTEYPDYGTYQRTVLQNVKKSNEHSGADPRLIAEVIYQAATDNRNKLRYLAGKDIRLFAKVRRLLPEGLFMRMVKKTFEKS